MRAAADHSSDTTMWLLIGLGVATFLVGFAVLIAFTVALVRPLASLKENARAIISGDQEARAKVWGLEETASLARDLNEMTETLVAGSAKLEESEGRFRDVLDVSRDLIYKLNLKSAPTTTSALPARSCWGSRPPKSSRWASTRCGQVPPGRQTEIRVVWAPGKWRCSGRPQGVGNRVPLEVRGRRDPLAQR